MVTEIKTAEQFEKDVLGKSGFALVDFFSLWCRPCKMMGPVIEGASELFEGQVSFYKVNVDEVSELASKYEIMSIPNMIMFKDGKPVGSITGYHPIAELKQKIHDIIG